MKFCFYFPTKVRFILNQVNSLDLENNIAEVNAAIEVKIKLMNPVFIDTFINKMARRLKLKITSAHGAKIVSFSEAQLNDDIGNISYWDDIERYEREILDITTSKNQGFQGYVFYVRLPDLKLSFDQYCKYPPFDMIDLNFSVHFS